MTPVAIRVPNRFSGPIGYANGGWIAGLVAQASGLDPAEITLRRPIPLETDLELSMDAGTGEGRLTDGEALIVEVRPGAFQREVPEFITPEAAVDAEAATLVRSSPDYGHCLVCGVDRPDGYRLRPGVLSARPDSAACLWRPASMQPPLPVDATIPAVWAALDCPGVWTIDAPRDPMLLGRMTASVLHAPDLSLGDATDDMIVVARQDARDGRKMQTSTALYSLNGQLLAHAEQVWIAVTTHPRMSA